MAKLDIAIIGAGMSGLLFAIALHEFATDVEFTIYEGASQLTEIGAGITIQNRAWDIMRAVGLEDTLKAIAGTTEALSMEFEKGDQAQSAPLVVIQAADDRYTFYRAELQKILLEHLRQARPNSVLTSKRFVSYDLPEGSGPITIRFQDGSAATCDLLVGADGVKSAVRGAMYSVMADVALSAGRPDEAAELKSHILPIFSGFVSYRALIRKDSLSEADANHPALNIKNQKLIGGKNRHVVLYSISGGRVINVAVVVSIPGKEGTIYEGPWTASVDRDEWFTGFSTWDPNVQAVLKHVGETLKWAIHTTTKLPTYTHGRVALIGDAAHAMTPNMGQGAGQGFEDAFFLAQMLGREDITLATAHNALNVYDTFRRPVSQLVTDRSRTAGRRIQFNDLGYESMSEEESATGRALTAEQLRDIGGAIEENLKWYIASTIEEDKGMVFEMLDKAVRESGA